MLAQVFWGGAAAVAGLFGAFLLVGWLAARKMRYGTAQDMILAGRALPIWIAVLTTTATWVDGGYLLGTVEFTQSSLAAGAQGGVCFGLSLILGGLFFARRMRALEFTTLVDPFEVRFGRRWAAVLLLPAMAGEMFWSAELLVAIGSTFGVILDFDLASAIILSAAVVTLYTMIGGMWSVAYTDAFQLALIPIGMLAALPFAIAASGGWETVLEGFRAAQGSQARLAAPLDGGDPAWPFAARVAWWELSVMLVLGGIPWNCYFQRVLCCQTPERARWHSVLAGLLTIALTVPPVLLGMAALTYAGWTDAQRQSLAERPALALPMLLVHMTPYAVALLGMAAITGAVTSSFSSSILSAGSMFSWNVYRRLLAPDVTVARLTLVLRTTIVLLGVGAALLALYVQSVGALWFFTADLVFVLLFPQLVAAMWDARANRIGSVAAFVVALAIRLAGGIDLLGVPALVDYPSWVAPVFGQDPAVWRGAAGESLFPVKLAAAAAGLILLPGVSRLTARWDPPRPLGKVEGAV